MPKRKSEAMSLLLEEVLCPEFVQKVLDSKMTGDETPIGQLLRRKRPAALARNGVLEAFRSRTLSAARLSDLTVLTPSEVKDMAKLGNMSLEWLEAYLPLLDVKLARPRSVKGMSKAAQDFLASL